MLLLSRTIILHWGGGVAQAVRGLPRKHEALSSTLVLQKKTKQTNKIFRGHRNTTVAAATSKGKVKTQGHGQPLIQPKK
jgi:hypothetical protein